MSSNVATAKITDPTAVEARCTTRQSPYHPGAIFCECPELGFEGDNLIYCRYGLPLPNIQVADDSKLWIEATIGDRIRWKYTGFADTGGTVDLLKLVSDSSAESYVLGDTLKAQLDTHEALIKSLQTIFNTWVPVLQDGGGALSIALKVTPVPALGGLTWVAAAAPDYDNILSTKVKGE